MDAKFLEKIEELTLYTIQLKKANQRQNEELQVVKWERQQDQQELHHIKQLLQDLLKRH